MTTDELILDELREIRKLVAQQRFGDDELWTVADIADYTHYGETKAYQLVDRPGFPAPAKLMGASSQPRWHRDEVIAWTKKQHGARK